MKEDSKTMRTFKLIIAITGLLICPLFLLGLSVKPIEEVEILDGTWRNPDYNVNENKYAKIKFKTDKTWYTYTTTTSKEETEKGTYSIVKGWRGNGSTYYKVIRISEDESIQYELYGFSKLYKAGHLGKVLEIESSTEDFPTEINPNSSTYSILNKSIFFRRVVITIVIIGVFALYSMQGGQM